MIRDTPGGVELDVRVIPRARKTTLDGVRDGALLVRVAAAPRDGAANDALIEYLAGALRLPRQFENLRAARLATQVQDDAALRRGDRLHGCLQQRGGVERRELMYFLAVERGRRERGILMLDTTATGGRCHHNFLQQLVRVIVPIGVLRSWRISRICSSGQIA